MKPRIAILAALPRELAPLVRHWPQHERLSQEGAVVFTSDRAVAVCAGMGRERAALALTLAARQGPLREVLSVGYAGALRQGIARNSIVSPVAVIDARDGQRFECPGGSGVLLTSNGVLGPREKSQAATRWHADLVDMEAAAVAQSAQQLGLPFRAVKVITDEVEDILPDMSQYTNAQGAIRESAFAASLLLRPWQLPAALRIGRRAAQASQVLAHELRRYLEEAV